MMKTILITAIGGDIAQGVAKVIRGCKQNFRLIGTDIHGQHEHGGGLFVDKYCVVPRATDNSYKNEILKLIDTEAVDIVIPISEPELGVLHDCDKACDSVQWVMPGSKVIQTGLDKLATIQQLDKLGLKVPWTKPVADGAPAELPCIMKDRFGSGSKNVFLVRDKLDVDYFTVKYPHSIYQELLLPADREVTCAVYRTLDQRVAVYQMQRKLVGGLTGWAQIIDNEAVKDMCERIAHGLELLGSMNIQLRITDDGPRVFEINPRFSSTTLMRHRLGFTDLIWSLDELAGHNIKFPSLPIGRIAVKTFDAEIVL